MKKIIALLNNLSHEITDYAIAEGLITRNSTNTITTNTGRVIGRLHLDSGWNISTFTFIGGVSKADVSIIHYQEAISMSIYKTEEGLILMHNNTRDAFNQLKSERGSAQ